MRTKSKARYIAKKHPRLSLRVLQLKEFETLGKVYGFLLMARVAQCNFENMFLLCSTSSKRVLHESRACQVPCERKFNICCCFLQAGAVEKIKRNIQNWKFDASKSMSCRGHYFKSSPVDSILDAVLTVSPNKQYLGILRPTTPEQTGPLKNKKDCQIVLSMWARISNSEFSSK